MKILDSGLCVRWNTDTQAWQIHTASGAVVAVNGTTSFVGRLELRKALRSWSVKGMSVYERAGKLWIKM